MIAFTRQSPKRTKGPDISLHAQQEKMLQRADDEQGPALGERNRTAGNLPDEACLHELFEAQVEAKPKAEALVVGAERLTYRELNFRANRVAHHLRFLGVGPETLVGIFLERSADMVVAMLGVLKAGGAYVPLDPSYPPDRLKFMLEDARVHSVLTQSSLVATLHGFELSTGQAPHIVCLDLDQRIALASAENPDPSAQACNLSYILYTSGSTGRPKGVALEHRNAVSYVHWAGQVYSARELDGVLAGISISFDLSILDIFVTLSLGGKVIMAPNTLALPGLASAMEVRLITTVPSAARELLRIGGIPTSVETINLAGEPLSIQLVQQLYALPHIKRVYDLYGPTETTTNSTFALRTSAGPAIIGRPIANTQVYLLDENLSPVPVGTTGELFIGGEGVARGYLNRPEITAEKFIHLPLAAGRKARLYRTGDLCRYRPDGNLEFIGRRDHQVKIRGHRIELGEIESVLLTHPAVGETVVIAPEEASGERRRLVAYVVLCAVPGRKKETRAAAEQRIVPQLRSHLQGRLPDYMLPGTFMLLERFELTPSGKINRAMLPAPVRTRAAAGDYLAPRTPTEELLCEIWSGLLGLKQVGVHDNFFQLGGDSLQGVAMLAEVERKTDRKLPVETALQASSVSHLAAFLDGMSRSHRPASGSPWVEIQPQGSRPPLFLVHGIGGGMLWGYANLARHLGTDQPIHAFKACDPDQLEKFDTIEKMAAHYVEELRRFQPEGPYALGGYCFGGNVAYEMARLLDQQGQRVSLLALMNAAPPDSSYDQVDWTPLYLCKFLHNLGLWVNGFMQWNRVKKWRFMRWKIRIVKKKTVQWLRPTPARSTGLDVEELIDLSAVPNDKRYVWESHVRALDDHKTGPYSGKVVLLRTRGHPLNCSYDWQCGWGEL
ncbi:MAG TPA: amino acid adenylation domain-containing protein, partial [Opitutaceae bacterium]|nr:amino acid adenylation domain-containing protein [Opitutaceae bacterium]